MVVCQAAACQDALGGICKMTECSLHVQMVAQLAKLAERLKAEPQVASPSAAGPAPATATIRSPVPNTTGASTDLSSKASKQGSAAEHASPVEAQNSGPSSPPAASGLSSRPSGSGQTTSFGAGRLRRMNLGNTNTTPIGASQPSQHTP